MSPKRPPHQRRNLLSHLWTLGLDFAIPWKCVLCGSLDETGGRSSQGEAYCVSCEESLVASVGAPDQSCQRCGAQLGPYVTNKSGCVHCRNKPLKFDSVTCLGMYDHAIRDAVLSAKYSPSDAGLQAICQLLIDQRLLALRELESDLVIPIPHHWRARLTRHFNSAAIVGSALARALKLTFDDHTLCRTRLTRLQKRVSLMNRFENQKGAFRVRDERSVRGKRVLLVDDVLTTGATCSEAARVLKAAGAKSCHVAVIARVLDSAMSS